MIQEAFAQEAELAREGRGGNTKSGKQRSSLYKLPGEISQI